MNEEQIKIENEFNVLFNGLSDQNKMDITNHIFNMGLPEFPHFFHTQKGMRLGQHFINVLPVQLKESFSSIFYSEDIVFMEEQINRFVQKIFNDPIQNQ